MSKADYYVQKKEFIKTLNDAFAPLTDFGGVSYAHLYGTEAEYLKIDNTVGNSVFLDVTASDRERILIDVMSVVVGNEPVSMIKPKAERRKAAAIFARSE